MADAEYGEEDDRPVGAEGDAEAMDLSTEDTTSLPPFANAENKDLDARIKELEREVEGTDAGLDENKDRINIMTEHLRNVQQELIYTQSRVDAKNKEIETEDHLKQLSEHAGGRLHEQVRALEREQLELEEKMAVLQSSVYKGNEKMDQFKLLMNWNQEELEQWALASRQKEEDNLALQKYTRADDARIKELNLAIEKMTKQVNSKKQELEDEVTETQAAQIQLDKTAQDFRELHNERQELVVQWEEAVEAMKRRDAAIQAATEQFAAKKAELREVQAVLDDRARFLEQEIGNNKEIDARIAIADRGIGKLRVIYNEDKAQLSVASDEVEVLQTTLNKAANDLSVARTENEALAAEEVTKQKRLEAVTNRLAKIEANLDGEKEQLMTLDEKLQELSDIQASEEQHLKDAQREVVELKDRMFKSSQELFGLRTEERDLIAKIAGGQSQNKNLSAKIAQLDANVVKQQELLYHAEFQVQQLERKVSRASGERSDEEKKHLNARIDVLTKELEDKMAQHSMLTASVKRAEDDGNAARRKNALFTKEVEALNGKISELTLESDTAIRSVKAAVQEKEDKMVSHDVLKLEVKRLRDVFNTRSDEVASLENRKFQLQMSMEERKHEIEVYREVLRAQLKTVTEDIHKCTLEQRERALRAQKLQSKYEVVAARMGEKEGEENSQAYYVIKAAQEREELQREGDELDAKIRKAEKEVRALEETLIKLNEKNNMFSSSFRRVEDTEALGERATLREKLDRTYDKMKFRRNEERSLQQDLEQQEARLDNLRREESTLTRAIDEIKQRKEGLEHEVEEQDMRAARAEKRLVKLQRELHERMGVGEGDELPEELDFRLQEMRDAYKLTVAELGAAAVHAPVIAEKLDAVGIKLPMQRGGGFDRPPSVRSQSSQGSFVPVRQVQFAP